MSPAHIRVRVTKAGKRYDVRFRFGGRGYRVNHAGTFSTLKEARARRDLVAGELAAGRDPRVLLAELGHAPAPALTMRQVGERWVASRIDVAEPTRDHYRSRLKRIDERLGDRRPDELTVADVADFITEISNELAPGTVGLYADTLRQVLDFAGVDPNPTRSPLVKLPRQEREVVRPPSSSHLLAVLETVSRRWRLTIVVLEQTGMRVSETLALAWGDVDVVESRFLLEKTKTNRPRWVQVPDWLMELVAETCPLEDRVAGRKLFPGIERTALRNAIANACKVAGIPHFSPHDLRHRRVSLWHGQGVPAAELAARVGHARPSITQDVYSHVMPLDEAPALKLAELVRADA